MCTVGPFLATTAIVPQLFAEDLNGEFVIAEGGALLIQAVLGAAGSGVVVFGITWEEQDKN